MLMPSVIYWLLNSSASDLHRRTLGEHADTIALFCVRMQLPPGLQELYAEAYGRYAYAVLDDAGHVLFSSILARSSLAIEASLPPASSPWAMTSRRRTSWLAAPFRPAQCGGLECWSSNLTMARAGHLSRWQSAAGGLPGWKYLWLVTAASPSGKPP